MIDLRNKKPKLLVIGDLIIDKYLWGNCERISPEAPVQIVNIKKENTVLGGAGNVVNNLCSLGAKVDVISVIGNCNTSIVLKTLLNEIGVSTKFLVTQENRITPEKSRIIASQQQVVRYDTERIEDISNQSEDFVANTFNKIIANYDAVLLSDYGKGVLTANLTKYIIESSKQHNKKVLVDPKGLNYSKYKGAFLLTPNRKEASEATGIKIVDDKSLSKALLKLKEDCLLHFSIITLSENGIALFDDKVRIHPTASREVYDVTGAGDTILASLGFAISCNYEINRAVEFSNIAAGIVVGKIGSSTTTINEIIEYESSLNKSSSENHIKQIDEIEILSNELSKRGKRIVFTNGCFDLLHAGHVKYLETAKSFGDILIVGLNSDNSVTKLKGKNRPINNQNDRAFILAALEVVDYVVIFDNETPYDLIKIIKPAAIVKGGDYKGKDIIGHDLVKEIRLVEFVNGKSTSQIIQKILQKQ